MGQCFESTSWGPPLSLFHRHTCNGGDRFYIARGLCLGKEVQWQCPNLTSQCSPSRWRPTWPACRFRTCASTNVEASSSQPGHKAATAATSPQTSSAWCESESYSRSEEHTSALQSPMRTTYAAILLENNLP